MDTPLRPCPICRLPSQRRLFTKNACDIYLCPACQFSYVMAVPDTEQLKSLYDESYFHGEPSKFGYFDYSAEKENRIRAFESKRRFIVDRFPAGGRVLDVGCADGSFLEMFPPEWETDGVELSESVCNSLSPALRPRVFQGFFEDFPERESTYDVITLWDVLDHVKEPQPSLQKAYRLLKPGGYLGLVTGDRNSLLARLMGKHWYLYVPPVHLSFFSAHASQKALNQAGYTNVEIVYEGKWVSLPLIAYRLAHLIPFKRWEAFFASMANRMPNLNIEINLFDVMTIWAQKPHARP